MFRLIKKILANYHMRKMAYWDEQWWNEYSRTGKGFYFQNYNRMVHQQKYIALTKGKDKGKKNE